MNIKSNIFFYLILLLSVLAFSAGYVRFVILHDYMVGYEGECDPATAVCFIGCENDECTTNYFYTKMQKYEPRLFEQCGDDITDCEEANYCLSDNDEKCLTTYCNPEVDIDICEKFTKTDFEGSENSINNQNNEFNEQILDELNIESNDVVTNI